MRVNLVLLAAFTVTACGNSSVPILIGDLFNIEDSTLVDVVDASALVEVQPSDTRDETTPLLDMGDDHVGDLDLSPDDACTPNCDGRECGDDGCGGSCGTCGDDDPCNGNDLCEGGTCVQDSPPDCDDDNPCTTDSCVENQGCENTPLEDKIEPACDDGNTCTENVCISGECWNPLKDLEDLVVEDCICDDDEACEPLEDDNLCNGTLVCDTEAEIPTCVVAEGSVVICTLPEEAATECNVPVCDTEDGSCSVASVNEGGSCNDGEPCTDGEQCQDGVCTNGVPTDCGDDDPCTEDNCDLELGCVHTALNVDDGDLCTVDTCDPLSPETGYASNVPVTCAANPCIVGVCNPDNGLCDYSLVSCDDGDPCTIDACNNVTGDCLHPTLDCPAADSCSIGSCNPEVGCVLEPVDCTDCIHSITGDTVNCPGGEGPPGFEINDCTQDFCDPSVGCYHLSIDNPLLGCGDCLSDEDCGGAPCLGGSCCIPTCDDGQGGIYSCGDDGCGGTCGICSGVDTCDPDSHECVCSTPCPDGVCCGLDEICGAWAGTSGCLVLPSIFLADFDDEEPGEPTGSMTSSWPENSPGWKVWDATEHPEKRVSFPHSLRYNKYKSNGWLEFDVVYPVSALSFLSLWIMSSFPATQDWVIELSVDSNPLSSFTSEEVESPYSDPLWHHIVIPTSFLVAGTHTFRLNLDNDAFGTIHLDDIAVLVQTE